MKAIIFDLWNTLVKPGATTFTQCLADALSMEEDYIRDYIRASSSRNSNIHYSQIVQEIWHYTHKTSLDKATHKKVEDAYAHFVSDAKYINGASECLVELRENNFKIGVVSNATSVTIAVAKTLGLHEKVDDVFISCMTGYLKPDPRAFRMASRTWGVDEGDVVVVGDKITTDILGAKLAKMNVIWYAPHIKVMDVGNMPVDITAIVSDLRAIPTVLGCNKGTVS